MTNFEYKTIFADDLVRMRGQGTKSQIEEEFNKSLNELGRQGWELVSIAPYGSENWKLVAVFKRVLR